MNERWRDIADYVGAYQVSDLGRVRSLPRVVTRRDGRTRTISGKVLQPAFTPKGYAVVNLRRPGSSRTFLVNRLVVEVFSGPIPAGMETRHMNGAPGDNRLENLMIGTPIENAADKLRHGTYWRSHCRKGHELSGDNLVVGPHQRKCRTCRDTYGREYRSRLKLNSSTPPQQP